MNYLPTIRISHDKHSNKFVVVAGLLDYPIGQKHNYFEMSAKEMTNRESKAMQLLGIVRFPKGRNCFDSLEEAESWMSDYVRYAKAVIALPVGLRTGHSCEFWK